MNHPAQEENQDTKGTELSMNKTSEVTGGKGAISIPSKPIAETLSSIVCGGHEWVRTGREAEAPFLVFWTKHQKQYRCAKCGKIKWLNED